MTGTLVWITGLPSAGKSRFARAAQSELDSRRIASCLLDGDEVRTAMVPNPGYDPESRDRFYATLGNLYAARGGEAPRFERPVSGISCGRTPGDPGRGSRLRAAART
jgi:adenylylsulfate kinase